MARQPVVPMEVDTDVVALEVDDPSMYTEAVLLLGFQNTPNKCQEPSASELEPVAQLEAITYPDTAPVEGVTITANDRATDEVP